MSNLHKAVNTRVLTIIIHLSRKLPHGYREINGKFQAVNGWKSTKLTRRSSNEPGNLEFAKRANWARVR
jgi:hypothetical protein